MLLHKPFHWLDPPISFGLIFCKTHDKTSSSPGISPSPFTMAWYGGRRRSLALPLPAQANLSQLTNLFVFGDSVLDGGNAGLLSNDLSGGAITFPLLLTRMAASATAPPLLNTYGIASTQRILSTAPAIPWHRSVPPWPAERTMRSEGPAAVLPTTMEYRRCWVPISPAILKI